MKIKTIDISFKEWFDKVNGNSYNAGEMVLNYGMKNEKKVLFPFEYGYGDYYMQRCDEYLKKNNIINSGTMHLSYYCRDNGIILRSHIERGCLKRELKQYDVIK